VGGGVGKKFPDMVGTSPRRRHCPVDEDACRNGDDQKDYENGLPGHLRRLYLFPGRLFVEIGEMPKLAIFNKALQFPNEIVIIGSL
jgi:hypothetical protein